MTSTFNHAISKDFVLSLAEEAKRGGWWADVLADKDLLIAIRNKCVNVYWRGQSLFRIEKPKDRLVVTTHEKFLLDPSIGDQVQFSNGIFSIEALIKKAFIGNYDGPHTLAKMKQAAGIYSGIEKTGCHAVAVKNGHVIDVEIAFPGVVIKRDGSTKRGPRVDLAVLEKDGSNARLVFWEAKAFGNKELVASDSRNPAVIEQIEIYRDYLIKHRASIEESYRTVAANLHAINTMRVHPRDIGLVADVGHGNRTLTLGTTPKVGLLIFGFDRGQRDGRDWKDKHLPRLKAAPQISTVKAVGDAKKVRI